MIIFHEFLKKWIRKIGKKMNLLLIFDHFPWVLEEMNKKMGKNKEIKENESAFSTYCCWSSLLKIRVNKMGKNWNKENESVVDLWSFSEFLKKWIRKIKKKMNLRFRLSLENSSLNKIRKNWNKENESFDQLSTGSRKLAWTRSWKIGIKGDGCKKMAKWKW